MARPRTSRTPAYLDNRANFVSPAPRRTGQERRMSHRRPPQAEHQPQSLDVGNQALSPLAGSAVRCMLLLAGIRELPDKAFDLREEVLVKIQFRGICRGYVVVQRDIDD
jgi:hypothetical protein